MKQQQHNNINNICTIKNAQGKVHNDFDLIIYF